MKVSLFKIYIVMDLILSHEFDPITNLWISAILYCKDYSIFIDTIMLNYWSHHQKKLGLLYITNKTARNPKSIRTFVRSEFSRQHHRFNAIVSTSHMGRGGLALWGSKGSETFENSFWATWLQNVCKVPHIFEF